MGAAISCIDSDNGIARRGTWFIGDFSGVIAWVCAEGTVESWRAGDE